MRYRRFGLSKNKSAEAAALKDQLSCARAFPTQMADLNTPSPQVNAPAAVAREIKSPYPDPVPFFLLMDAEILKRIETRARRGDGRKDVAFPAEGTGWSVAYNTERSELLGACAKQASEGKLEHWVDGYLSKDTERFLSSRGFSVESTYDDREMDEACRTDRCEETCYHKDGKALKIVTRIAWPLTQDQNRCGDDSLLKTYTPSFPLEPLQKRRMKSSEAPLYADGQK